MSGKPIDLAHYDPMERSVQQNPFPYYAAMRRESPVFHHRNGMYFITTMDAVHHVLERPLVFADDDRPGIMRAGAVRSYLNRYAVLPGRNALIQTNNDDAYRTALDLHRAGAEVTIADLRPNLSGPLPSAAKDAGIEVLGGHAGLFKLLHDVL